MGSRVTIRISAPNMDWFRNVDYLHFSKTDMLQDLVINLPKDHLKHMKRFVHQRLLSPKDADRVILLISPDLTFDVKKLVQLLIKDLGIFAISRRCVMDKYEKHVDYVKGCISPELMSTVTKTMTLKDPVPVVGWLMFDYPCTVREARCLQQDGVLPTVTLALMPTLPVAPPAENPLTPARNFYQQDFEGLKYSYKATLKEVQVNVDDDIEIIATKCFNAVCAANAGAQGLGQGFHAVGAPGVYRVLIIGPRGSGRKIQGVLTAKHFDLIYLNFQDLFREASLRNDDIGEKLRKYGWSDRIKAEIIKRRIMQKECINRGWVLTGYPTSGADFEYMDNMPTPPNRIIILNAEWATCKARTQLRGADFTFGQAGVPDSVPRVPPVARGDDPLDDELDNYFTETLAELRAAAGITAVEVDANLSIEQVQVKIQAAIMAAPAFDIEYSSQLKNVKAD